MQQAGEEEGGADAHKLHFEHTINALSFIRTQMQVVRFSDIDNDKFVELPPSEHQKVLILDMDETMIHCVDDIETQ